MNLQERNIIWLDLFEFLGYHRKRQLLDMFGNVDIKASFLSDKRIYDILSEQEISKMSALSSDEKLDRVIESYENAGIITITIFDERYPAILKEISTPPLCLYCKGNIQLLDTYCVGVVGSRRATDYGLVVTEKYVKALTEADVCIVSGMALGVDTIAHKTAIENQGKTIAVLAGGFNHIYPTSNIGLFRKLIEDNLVISENNPNIPPLAYQFPIRNRIIAGLSRAVLVTEANIKSGSLITKEYALEYDRELFAVPGKITSQMSSGTNALIRDLQGVCTIDPDDMINRLGLKRKEKNKNSSIQLDIDTKIVLDYIQTEKHTFQEIVDFIKIPANKLSIILTELEIANLVKRLPNNSYIAT